MATTAQKNKLVHSEFIQRYQFIESIRDAFDRLHNIVIFLLPIIRSGGRFSTKRSNSRVV